VAVGVDLTYKFSKYIGFGINGYFGKDDTGEAFTQIEMRGGAYIPINIKSVALTPFADVGFGMMFLPPDPNEFLDLGFHMGASFRAGLIFTTEWVKGLYLQAAYQGNFYPDWFALIANEPSTKLHPDVIYIGVGYSFK
jgi:hypothetical protein